MRQLRNFKQDSITSNQNELLNQAYQKYGGLSQDALIEQLVAQVQKAKQDGTYDKEQMQNYINLMSPMLNGAQRQKLDNVLKVLDAEA